MLTLLSVDDIEGAPSIEESFSSPVLMAPLDYYIMRI